MIANFHVENYLSFKKLTKISFAPSSIKEYKENVYVNFLNKEMQFLKSIALFGHNAHGKTNLIKAISFMKDFVLNSSSESQVNKKINVRPFKLSTETEEKPSSFQLEFYIGSEKFRYGFSANSIEIKEEWLFETNKKKESLVFIRAGQNFSIDKKFKTETKGKLDLFQEMTRNNSLFLSVMARFNNELCIKISKYFFNLLIVQDIDHESLINFTAQLMSKDEYRRIINEIIKNAKLGIESIEEKAKEISTRTNYSYSFLTNLFSEQAKEFSIKTIHNKYKDQKKVDKIVFDLMEEESYGTQKFFGLLGVILYSLKESIPLFVDEIDARIHTALFELIISLYNSENYNSKGSQLLFTAHNINILKKGLRRDQMYFIEKNEFGESEIASLHVKLPKVRNDASFDKDYLAGKYGAIIKPSEQLELFKDF